LFPVQRGTSLAVFGLRGLFKGATMTDLTAQLETARRRALAASIHPRSTAYIIAQHRLKQAVEAVLASKGKQND